MPAQVTIQLIGSEVDSETIDNAAASLLPALANCGDLSTQNGMWDAAKFVRKR